MRSRSDPLSPSFGAAAMAIATLLCLLPGAASEPPGTPSLAEADAWWRARADHHAGGRPDPMPIRKALEAYESLLASRPDDLEVRWKLLRAQHFLGEYVLSDRTEKRELFESARALADESRQILLARHDLAAEDDIDAVANQLAGVRSAAAVFYYSAVHWGLWGETTGRLRAARAGVGDRLRHYGSTVVAIDPTFDEAAGHRLLGRLHTEAPRIPLVTGWVDRDVAVAELERACEIAPQNPFNQLYLADALLRFRGERHTEAIERLERLTRSEPRPQQLIEDMAAIEESRRLLEENRS